MSEAISTPIPEPLETTEAPRIGTVVMYVLPEGPNKGHDRPAMVVRRWGDHLESAIQLQVFTDGSNDGPRYAAGISWKTSAAYSAQHEFDHWHW